MKDYSFYVSHLVVCVYFPYLLWAPYLSGKLTITWVLRERQVSIICESLVIAHLPVTPGVDCPLRSAVENVTGTHIATLLLPVAAKIRNNECIHVCPKILGYAYKVFVSGHQ